MTIKETVTFELGAGRLCNRPGCVHLVEADWDPKGRLCANCALDDYLYDREARWEELAETAAAARA